MTSRKVLTDREFIDAWMRFFGVTTGLRLLGWCAVTAVRLPADPSRRDLLEQGWGSVSTRYRNLHQLVAFKEHLAEKGWALDADDSGEPAARLVAELRLAS